jgi:hypothetical protein
MYVRTINCTVVQEYAGDAGSTATNSARHHRFGRRLRLDDARALIRPPVLARYSRVTIIRGQTILAIAGALLFVFSPSTPLALAGVLLWGVGASLGFPVA